MKKKISEEFAFAKMQLRETVPLYLLELDQKEISFIAQCIRIALPGVKPGADTLGQRVLGRIERSRNEMDGRVKA